MVPKNRLHLLEEIVHETNVGLATGRRLQGGFHRSRMESTKQRAASIVSASKQRDAQRFLDKLVIPTLIQV